MCGCLQPICELFFAHASAGNCHHGLIVINLGGRRLQVIELKKGKHRHACCAFVAIEKGMILTEMETVCGSHVEDG